jgi:MFS family permease
MAGADEGRFTAAARLALLFAVHAIGTANIMAVMAFAPAIQADLGVTPATFGLLVAAYYAAQPVVALPAGWLVDRIGVRAALCIAMVTTVGAAALLALAGGPAMAAATLVLGGIGYSLVNPATTAGVVAWFPPGWRSTMMSVKQAGVPMGGMLAAAVATIVGASGWREASAAVAIGALVVAAASLLGARPGAARHSGGAATGGGRSRPPVSLLPLLRNGPLLRVCLATGFLSAAQSGFYAYLVLYLVGPVGLSPAVAAAVFGSVHAVSAISRILWGMLADRWWRGDARSCLRVIAYAACAGFLLLSLGHALGAPAAVAAALLLGATVSGFAGVAQGAAVAEAPRHQIGAAMGVFMILTPFGSLIGPPAFGGLLAIGESFLLPTLVLAAVAAAVGLFVAGRGRVGPG